MARKAQALLAHSADIIRVDFKASKKGRKTRAERFWEKVAIGRADECWPWKARTVGKYGHGGFDRRTAHSVAYELEVGPVPHGMLVMHACDNPRCVNPKHLAVGTYIDNASDMALKGRAITKLTSYDIKEIISLYDSERGMPRRGRQWTHAALANRYGVCKATVTHVLSGRNWRHHTSIDRCTTRVVKASSTYRRVSPNEARAIYLRASAGHRKIELADEFDVSFKTVDRICRGASHRRHTGADVVPTRIGTRHGERRAA